MGSRIGAGTGLSNDEPRIVKLTSRCAVARQQSVANL
jgi:hypothetical protein